MRRVRRRRKRGGGEKVKPPGSLTGRIPSSVPERV